MTAWAQSPPKRSTAYAGTFSQTLAFPAAVYAPNLDLTIEAWVYREDAARCETILSQDYTRSFWLGFCGGKVRFYRSGQLFADADLGVPARRWTHVAASYSASGSSGTVSFYIDGQPAGVKALNNAGAGHNLSLYLGSDPNRFVPFAHFNFKGALDEVRLWSVARTQEEIRAGRFQELRTGTGLVAVFPAGGRVEVVGNRLPAVMTADTVEQVAGILPRDLIVPVRAAPAVVDGNVSDIEYEGAEELVVRYRDGTNEVDTVARIVASGSTYVLNYPIFVGVSGFHTADAQLPGAHLALAWGPRPLERTVPGSSDHRITGFYDDWSFHREEGDGLSGFQIDVFPTQAVGKFAFCDGEFQPPCLEFGTPRVSRNTGVGLMLYHWKTNRVFLPPLGWRTVFEYAYTSPFDAQPNDPSTWARVTFGSEVGAAASVVANVRVVEPFLADGVEVPRAGVPVYLTTASGTLLKEGWTDTNGWASLNTLAATNLELRVEIAVPRTWRALGVDVLPGTGISPTFTTASSAAFPGCSEGRCDLSALVFKVLTVPEGGMSVTGIAPDTVWPQVVLRDSPLKTVGQIIEITGTNLHNLLRVWLTSCGILPASPVGNPWDSILLCSESQFYRLTNVQASADGRRLRVEFDAPASWLGSSRAVLLQDPVSRPGVVPWAYAPRAVVIGLPPYPQLWGFPFANERDGTQFDEFSNVYQWRAYDCMLAFPPGLVIPPVETCLGCRVPNPVYLTFHSLVFTPWVELMTGSCLGMSSTSLLFRRDQLAPAAFEPPVRYPAGFSTRSRTYQVGDEQVTDELGPPKPQEHRFRFCDYSEPVNLWAHIHRNQAMQVTAEFLGSVLSQMDGTGLLPLGAPGYSIAGNPVRAMNLIRSGGMTNHVLCFQDGADVFKAHAMVVWGALEETGLDAETALVPEPAAGKTVLRVYDPNHPEDVARYFEIDRAANTYRYRWGWRRVVEGGVTNFVPVIWSGKGVYAVPLDIFRGPGTMPGADLLARGLALLVFGAADAEYVAPDGGRWGYDAAGRIVETYEGGRAFAPFSQATPGGNPPTYTGRTAWFFPPTNRPPAQVAIRARGTSSSFFAGEAGTLFFLETRDLTPGDVDRVNLGQVTDRLGSLRYQPQRTRRDFTPTCGLIFPDKPSLVFAWDGLGLNGGRAVEWVVLRESAGVELRNDDLQPLRPTLRVLRGAAGGVQTNQFGPFEVGPGAAHRLRLPDWPRTFTLVSELDTNRDGQPEQWLLFAPEAPPADRPPQLTVALEGAQLRIAWPLSREGWVLERTDSLESPAWSPTPRAPVVQEGVAAVHVPLSGSAAFFRLRRAP